MPAEIKQQGSDAADAYWKSTKRLTLWLLLIWFIVTFAAIFFARSLSAYTLFGWPIPFFMAAQGSILIYVVIIAAYALRMRYLDKIYQHDKDRSEHAN